MNESHSRLFDFLSGGNPANHPSILDCPIQQGIPLLIDLAYTLLLWLALGAFIVGIVISVYFYLTAYGDEAKAKKGKETLKWTFIGAIVILFSAVAVFAVSNLLLLNPRSTDSVLVEEFDECKKADETSNTPVESVPVEKK